MKHKSPDLVGDAVPAILSTLGQGVNSAIQDAEGIAEALATCQTIEEAFEQYEKDQRIVTTVIQL